MNTLLFLTLLGTMHIKNMRFLIYMQGYGARMLGAWEVLLGPVYCYRPVTNSVVVSLLISPPEKFACINYDYVIFVELRMRAVSERSDVMMRA